VNSYYAMDRAFAERRASDESRNSRYRRAQIAHGESFHGDKYPDVKADYVLATPPFNESVWPGELIKDHRRCVYGAAPGGNANFACEQQFLHHLAPAGIVGFLLANGSMSSHQSRESEIRRGYTRGGQKE
jgi:type I restriction enzyme M protein